MIAGPHGKLTPREVAERLGRGLKFVMREIHGRRLAHERHPPAKRGGKPRYFVLTSDVEAWEAQHRVAPLSPPPAKGRDGRHRTKAEGPIYDFVG